MQTIWQSLATEGLFFAFLFLFGNTSSDLLLYHPFITRTVADFSVWSKFPATGVIGGSPQPNVVPVVHNFKSEECAFLSSLGLLRYSINN
jgi:hypothetical protein